MDIFPHIPVEPFFFSFQLLYSGVHVQDVQVSYIGKHVPWWFAAPINPSPTYQALHALDISPDAIPPPAPHPTTGPGV